MKIILSLSILILSNCLFAQNYMNLNKFLASKNESYTDISYVQMNPQYEENQPANKAIVLEFYSGEFDGSKKSKASLEYIKSLILEEKRLNPKMKISTLVYGKTNEGVEDSEFVKYIQTTLPTNGNTKTEIIPDQLNFNFEAKAQEGRSPDSIKIGRVGWTFIRGAAVTGSAFAGLVITQGLSAPLAASVAIWPGILSGAITYYSGAFGEFLTNGKWAKWFMESDKWFARKLRSAFRVNANSLGRKLAQNPRYFRVKYPNLYKNNPELFEKFIAKKANSHGKTKFKQLLSKLSTADEYLKWYLTEVIFVGSALKLPQAVAGVGAIASLGATAQDILVGSAYGMLAQGPGDLAIQKRKYQKLDELLELAKSNTDKFTKAEKLQLIDEITKIKDHSISYQIGKNSHRSLQKIENWGRKMATTLSFFSVAGVSLEMAGIPAAKPILISVGLGGGVYYAQVSGWIKFNNIKSLAKKSISKFGNFLKNPINIIMANIKKRMCHTPFLMPKY